MEYNRNDIPEIISVRSIRTVYDIVLDGKNPVGEAHDFPELIYVYRGEHVILLDGEPVRLSTGQMSVYAPMTYHIGQAPFNASVYIISFDCDSETIGKLYNRSISLTAEQSRLLTQIVFSAFPLFENIPRCEGVHGMKKREGIPDIEFQRLKNRFELFLLDVCHETSVTQKLVHQKSKAALLEDICGYLRQNLDKSVSLDDISQRFYVGKSTVTLLFKKEYGRGLIALFNQFKMEKAKLLIAENKMNFTEISESLGFSSVHYFSRTFKSIVGVSPSQYKRSVLNI